MSRPGTKVENISSSYKNQQLVLLVYQLREENVNSVKEVNCYLCFELTFSVQIWLSVRCPRPLYGPDREKLKSMCDNFGAVYRSYVDGNPNRRPASYQVIRFVI